MNVSGAKVLFQTAQLRCSGNRYDPRLLREQPRESDLRWRRLLFFRESCDHINQTLILLAVLLTELWDGVPEIGTVELRVGIDLSRQEALA